MNKHIVKRIVSLVSARLSPDYCSNEQTCRETYRISFGAQPGALPPKGLFQRPDLTACRNFYTRDPRRALGKRRVSNSQSPDGFLSGGFRRGHCDCFIFGAHVPVQVRTPDYW